MLTIGITSHSDGTWSNRNALSYRRVSDCACECDWKGTNHFLVKSLMNLYKHMQYIERHVLNTTLLQQAVLVSYGRSVQ